MEKKQRVKNKTKPKVLFIEEVNEFFHFEITTTTTAAATLIRLHELQSNVPVQHHIPLKCIQFYRAEVSINFTVDTKTHEILQSQSLHNDYR